MNENRSVFALDGLTGGIIATVLLLSILAFLSVNAIAVQHANAENYYKIVNEKSIKMFDTEAYKHIVDAK
jgi:hypothetical protein